MTFKEFVLAYKGECDIDINVIFEDPVTHRKNIELYDVFRSYDYEDLSHYYDYIVGAFDHKGCDSEDLEVWLYETPESC